MGDPQNHGFQYQNDLILDELVLGNPNLMQVSMMHS